MTFDRSWLRRGLEHGDAPVILRVEPKAGHGGGRPTSKRIGEASDIWTFVFWTFGITF